jgi:4-amino-4-deoxy-L-arabinose transferase-like glycosyltransferase
LAGLYLVNGQHAAPLIVVVQISSSLVSIYLALAIARHCFNELIARLTGIFYAVALISIAVTGLILTETIFTTLLLAAIYAVLRYAAAETARAWGWALGIAVLFALATYMRPIALYMLAIPLAALLVMGWRERRRWMQVALMIVVFGALLSPWYFRNWAMFGKLSFSSIGDFNLLLYNAASVYAYQEGVSVREAKDAVGVIFGERLSPYIEVKPVLNELEVVAVMRDTALEILLAQPLQTVWVHLTDALNVFRPGYSSLDLLLSDTPTAVGDNVQNINLAALTAAPPLKLLLYGLLTVQVLATLGLALVGSVILVFQRRFFVVWVVGGLSAWLVITPSIAGNARFRVPLEGILALLAAVAVGTGYDYWQRWQRGSYGGDDRTNTLTTGNSFGAASE